MIMKRLALAVAVAAAFLVGYGTATHAWPGVPDRAIWHGYFSNIFDDNGGPVIQTPGPGLPSIPGWVNSADTYIAFMEDRLARGSAHDQTGAAFIIDYQLGAADGWTRDRPPSAVDIAKWESAVRFAESHGGIEWNVSYNFTGNSYYQGVGRGSNPNDDAFYYQTDVQKSIVFHNADASVGTIIKRSCGNPVTNGNMPGLDQPWTSSGHTIVSDSTPAAGDRISFYHYVKNNGPAAATMFWGTFEGSASAGTGLGVSNGGPDLYLPGQELQVKTEVFTIPASAAAGTKYCRFVGWDPVNSSGARNGAGAQACATVVIAPRLKASMTASPGTIAPGQQATFTPSVHQPTSGSAVIMRCTIDRKSISPTGAVTSLGSLPCTDTSGNPNILIPPASNTTLQVNVYAAPATIPMRSQVCDTINIVSPTGSSYYYTPGDKTATACVTVAKSPYVQFTGGDVWAGGGFASVAPGTCANGAKITTVTSGVVLADGTTPGSGVTYGAFALGKITNFGSASMALVPASGIGDNWTFSNINAGNLGFYGAPQHCMSDYSALYTSAAPLAGGSTIDVAGQASGVWHTTGGLTIHGTMPPGSRQVYIVDGDVEIDSDLKYPATFGSTADIPSLVIISKHNVHAYAATSQIDGIIEVIGDGNTTGVFRTCWPKPAQATITTCPNKMTVNGSVLAGGLDLYRTAGADGTTPPQQKQPAETFNLSPEVYITNALNQNSSASVTTSNVRELPPRF